MFLENMTAEDVANLATKGIGTEFQELIYKQLKAQAELVARQVARQIADRLASQVTAMRTPLSDQLRVDLNFNMIDMAGIPAGEIIDVQNGVPLVAWSGNPKDLKGKKLFVAA
jgi:hypothetical protein